jgi:hypothetical protein
MGFVSAKTARPREQETRIINRREIAQPNMRRTRELFSQEHAIALSHQRRQQARRYKYCKSCTANALAEWPVHLDGNHLARGDPHDSDDSRNGDGGWGVRVRAWAKAQFVSSAPRTMAHTPIRDCMWVLRFAQRTRQAIL